MAPRLGEPGQVLTHERPHGGPVQITADARGLIWPASTEEVELCDRSGLPVIHDEDLPAHLAVPLPAAEPAASVDDERTIEQLRDRAAELGIEVPKGTRKRDLLELVRAAEADDAAAAAAATTDDPTTDDAGDDPAQED